MAGSSGEFSTVISADGTPIAYERHGQGPAVVFVDGAAGVTAGTFVGTPAAQVDQMRQAPWFRTLAALAPTLAYDHAGLLGPNRAVPVATAAQITVPALVMHGGDSVAFMRQAAEGLSQAIPGAELAMAPGQQHDLAAAVLAPMLAGFFAA